MAKKQPSPLDVSDPGVFHDENRHTCIRVATRGPEVLFVQFSVELLDVRTVSRERFEKEWTPISDYTAQRAAARYLFSGDGVAVPVSPEALVHLRRLAGPPLIRESLANDPAPDIPPSTPPKEPIMASKKPASEATPTPTPTKKPAKAAAAPTTQTKEKAPAKPKEKSVDTEASGTRGRQPNIAGSAKIKLLVKENPKRAAAAERFALYTNGMTVDEYIAAGGKRADVNWDVSQGFIEVK